MTKPGIIYGNLLNMTAGFLLASQGEFDGLLLLAALAGTSGIIAAACVFNNYIDRDIDKKMSRTRRRALVTGTVPASHALLFGGALGSLGVAILAVGTNALTLSLGLLGFAVYLTLYGWTKRKSVHGTLVGSIAGAIPPVAGYTAFAGQLDAGAWLLFAILVCWQMPHFYAIALYRLKDYKAAGIPVLPAVRGFQITRIHTISYIVGFIVANGLLTILGYTGIIYLVVMAATGLLWVRHGLQTPTTDQAAWGKSMFFFSLKVILILDVSLAVGALLP